MIVLGRQSVEAALNDVVSVEVLDQGNDVIGQRLLGNRDLLGGGEVLDHLLHGTCAMHVLRDLHKIGCHLFDDVQPLLIIAVLQQLLAEVVSERI